MRSVPSVSMLTCCNHTNTDRPEPPKLGRIALVRPRQKNDDFNTLKAFQGRNQLTKVFVPFQKTRKVRDVGRISNLGGHDASTALFPLEKGAFSSFFVYVKVLGGARAPSAHGSYVYAQSYMTNSSLIENDFKILLISRPLLTLLFLTWVTSNRKMRKH